jgi:hypothetical protein
MERSMSGEARDRSVGREEAEMRELEAAGWESKGRGAKTIWRSPAGGRWYAHYQAVERHRRSELGAEEERLLHKQGFEREPVEAREVWSRYEQGELQLYMRSRALDRARKETK